MEELTDPEFDEALQAVHVYLSKHKVLREQHGLKPNEGPTSSANRRELSFECVGTPMLHKYYSRKIFCQELHTLREGATPATATEREFEQALSRTNSVCHNLFVARNMANSYHYRGPQCWSHRHLSDKANVEPEDAPQRPLLNEKHVTGAFGSLVCSLGGKTRRVDNSTFNVFHNDGWLSESVALRREAFYADVPDFDDVLRTWFEATSLEDDCEVKLSEFHGFWEHSNYQEVRKRHLLASFEVFTQTMFRIKPTMNLKEIMVELHSQRNDCVGPASHCDILAKTSVIGKAHSAGHTILKGLAN